jgi:ribosomal protein L11 methylase PrmA
MKKQTDDILGGSFRDPSGFIFFNNGELYRQVNAIYRENYDNLMDSGLYQELVDSGLMVSHEEVSSDLARTEQAYKIIKPRRIDFISYPYEWCFSQLKDAALTTIAIQKKAFEHGMVLKDATAFNVQFINCKPIFIDTLSFEKYQQGQPWFAYKQFCQHFLAPLALMSYKDVKLIKLFRIFIDGVDLDLASHLLPLRSRFQLSLFMHIHLNAKAQMKYSDKAVDVKKRNISKIGFMGIIDSLQSAIRKLKWHPKGTEWGDYYEATNYSDEAMGQKERIVYEFLQRVNPKVTWDLGANTGEFSLLAKKVGSETIAFDIDPAAVEKNYRRGASNESRSVLPLVLDLTNPSGAIGWGHNERMSLLDRGPADAVLALALIHHLAISNNVPLGMIAKFFHDTCESLIIEFVPKEDSQVKRLLATREDIFPNYTLEGFKASFEKYFEICDSVTIDDSCRTMFLMKKKTE